MADTAHTPGPWEITEQNGDPEGGFRGVVGPMQTNSLGKDYRLYVAQYVEPKNAPLISAAPDLFEALKMEAQADKAQERLDAMNASPHDGSDDAWEDMASFVLELRHTARELRYAAISKAEGRS